jgi:tetratricopeptide (TPR) repeat protein
MPVVTLFQILVRERGWDSYTIFRQRYEAAARELAERCGDRTLANYSIGERQFARWLSGEVASTPRPGALRILAHLFQVRTEALFEPPAARPGDGTSAGMSGVGPEGSPQDMRSNFVSQKDVVMAAAEESAGFASRAERSNVGPHTLEQLDADIRRIVTTYPNRPIMPLFLEVRELRNRAFELLEGQQPPQYTRDLHLAAGTLCGVLANASFDLGQYAAAETQARTAFLCGELAGHNGLRAWVRGMQALIAYWDERPEDAVRFTEAGLGFVPEDGTAHIRLASIKARALARLGRYDDTMAALRSADERRSALTSDDLLGGMMAFPVAKQLFYASTAYLWLDREQSLVAAARDAAAAIDLYESDPPAQRRLGELSLARMDLAHAYLGQGDVDGAAEQLHIVLGVEARRRTESVGKRLSQFGRRLALTSAGNSAQGLNVQDSIAAYQEQRLRELPPGGTTR